MSSRLTVKELPCRSSLSLFITVTSSLFQVRIWNSRLPFKNIVEFVHPPSAQAARLPGQQNGQGQDSRHLYLHYLLPPFRCIVASQRLGANLLPPAIAAQHSLPAVWKGACAQQILASMPRRKLPRGLHV